MCRRIYLMKLVHEVLEDVRKKRAKADKIKILKDNETWALKDILRGSTDTTVTFNLPDGAPPYTPNNAESVPTNLVNKNKEFRWFVTGGPGDNLKNFDREKRYIQLLEGIHPEDAKLVISMIGKTKPEGVSRPVIDEAFPGLLKDEG